MFLRLKNQVGGATDQFSKNLRARKKQRRIAGDT